MVQVLPYIPGIGERIAPALDQAINTIGGALTQRRNNINDQKILQQFQQNPDLKPLDLISMYGRLSQQSQKSLSPLFETYIKDVSQPVNAKQQQIAEQKQINEDVLNRIEDLIPYSGKTYIPFTDSFGGESFNREAVERREELDDLSIKLEGVLRDASTKGSLPQKTFDTLLEKLPSSKKSEAQNRGSVKAFRRILGQQSPEVKKSVEKVLKKPDQSQDRKNVYDSTGKLVGTVDKNESNKLPQGYVVK